MTLPALDDIHRFYRAAALGLRFLEQREGRGRRFGEGANAGWRALGGALEQRDRLDLLIRDAGTSSPLAFSPRLVFQMVALADDEPFGPEWPQAGESVASACLKAAAEPEALGWNELLAQAAHVWGVDRAAQSTSLTEAASKVGPATRVVCAGFGAIFTLVAHVVDRAGLDLADQVVLVSRSSAERQLFGFGLLATNARKKPRLVSPEAATAASVGASGFPRADVVLVSEDAEPVAADAARSLAKELGAR